MAGAKAGASPHTWTTVFYAPGRLPLMMLWSFDWKDGIETRFVGVGGLGRGSDE